MKYGLLNEKNPDYAAATWRELEVLYRGGNAMTDTVRAALLPRQPNEPKARHEQRVNAISYINYFGQIANFFAGALFSKQLTVSPVDGSSGIDEAAYTAFSEDADKRGHTLQSVMKEASLWAMVKGKTLIAVDMPPVVEPAESLLEEERRGLGVPYSFVVQPEELLDWELDDEGRFTWAILKRTRRDRTAPGEARGGPVEAFKIWSIGEDGRAKWQLFETEPLRKGDKKAGERDIPLKDEGVTSFTRIPLVEFKLPPALWLGDYLSDMNREHFQRRSSLVSAENKSLFAIPWVKYGPQVGGVGQPVLSDMSQIPHRGADPRGQFNSDGYMELDAGDELGFASPDPAVYEHTREELRDLVDEMFRVGHQMAQSVTATSGSMGRSGVSKQEDRHATEIVLGAYGEEVRNAAVRVYDTIAGARGDNVFFQAQGLDSFEVWDRAQVLDEGTKVRQVAIPSKTFNEHYYGKVAGRLLEGATPEVMQAIREEIETAVAKMPEPGETPPPPPSVTDDDSEDDAHDTDPAPPPKPPRRRVVMP